MVVLWWWIHWWPFRTLTFPLKGAYYRAQPGLIFRLEHQNFVYDIFFKILSYIYALLISEYFKWIFIWFLYIFPPWHSIFAIVTNICKQLYATKYECNCATRKRLCAYARFIVKWLIMYQIGMKTKQSKTNRKKCGK